MIHGYTLAVMGLPVVIRARSLREARVKVLRRWLKTAGISSPNLPVVPTVVLIASDDPRAAAPDVCDARLAARRDDERHAAVVRRLREAVDVAERGLIEVLDGVSKEGRAT